MSESRLNHHRQLEQAFKTLMLAVHTEDPICLRAEWNAFEHQLLAHLDEEERDQLPAFARRNPHEARAIAAEHEQIRIALFQLGVQLDLHLLREETVAHFLDRLRAHAAREEKLLYPWIEAQEGRSNGLAA